MKILFFLFFLSISAFAISFSQKQSEDTLSNTAYLKRLSLEELMNIDITIVSKRPQQLFNAPASVHVVSGEDIKRSGATRIPEALRLAPIMEVAQIDPVQWAISTRGFNSGLANKLLVLIDGRSIYSPLFAGVFWDMQNVFMNDIDRIEIIGGPGATVWGANAVNGVINIVSKNAGDTKGLFVEGIGGTELRGLGGIRYGGSINSEIDYRVYGKYVLRDGAVNTTGGDIESEWTLGQGGFRLDWKPAEINKFTLQGDLYKSKLSLKNQDDPFVSGGNIIGLWTNYISETSDFTLQLYYDYVHRNVVGAYNDILNTFDVDFKHHFLLGTINNITWGGGYRLHEDNFMPGTIIFDPQKISLQIFNAFIQDEIQLLKDRLYLTIGSKFEHNDYTGFEFQPGVRFLWNINDLQTFWAAVSRAVRTPSRIDRNWVIPNVSSGSPDYKSEELLAYELGYRIHPSSSISVSLAAYYNMYDNIRSVETIITPPPARLVFGNGFEATTFGGDIKIDSKIFNWWLIRVGYSHIQIDFDKKPVSTDNSNGTTEAADSRHNFLLNSSMDLPANFKLDIIFRYVSDIENPVSHVPEYSELDLRVAYQLTPSIEVSVTGQNLLHDHHPEFGVETEWQRIERSIYGKVTFSLGEND